MNRVHWALALASVLTAFRSQAISLDDIQLWTGSGTNRAALVIEWNTPEILNNTTVPAPVANKTLVWGYRFNGTATAVQMFNAIVAANPQLYAIEYVDPVYGAGVQGIGFNLDGRGISGVTDGTVTDATGTFTNGVLIDSKLNVDGAQPLNSGDLFWSGFSGPYWQLWTEAGDAGGFMNSPNRGANEYWDPNSYAQGEWASAYYGLADLMLTNGSWIGFSISADGYPYDNTDPNYTNEMTVFNNDEQAPACPDGTYVAYVANTNDFAAEIVSTNNIYASSPYNDPAAVLGRPALRFYDPYDGNVTDRVSVIDDPFNVAPDGSKLITEIKNGGQITVKFARKIYDDPANPYGIDFIVYGNSFFDSYSGTTGAASDATDLNAATFNSSAIAGHQTVVSVSQDGTNWVTLPEVSYLFPANAYRWDDANDSWSDEEMNPNKPINPFIYTNNFGGETVATALDQFAGAAGGTGFSLRGTGLPWIQYVRLQPDTASYTVIDAIAAVNPATVGDALCITPDNVVMGVTNLAFQSPGDSSQSDVSINFDSLSELARVSTVALSDFSSFAPVIGNVSSGYQIQVRPVLDTNAVAFTADVALRTASQYAGNGSDLRVFQWMGTNWAAQAFVFDATNHSAVISGVNRFSAYAVSQIVPPMLSLQKNTNGYALQFAPVANCAHILEWSTNLMTWTPVATNTPAGSQMVTLEETNVPTGNLFYRLHLDIP